MSVDIDLARLRSHPQNCNKLGARELVKLTAHIKEHGDYPSIIVRKHATTRGDFEILDGHYRVHILRGLGRESAHCEVWDCDDARARVLLLTLNRLNGVDDVKKRGLLLEEMAATMPLAAMEKLVPDDRARIQRLIALNKPAKELVAAVAGKEMPESVAFFLVAHQRDALKRQLSPFGRDRSSALVELLGLNAEAGPGDRPDLGGVTRLSPAASC